MTSATAAGGARASMPKPTSRPGRPSTRLTAAKADGEEADERQAELGDGEEAARGRRSGGGRGAPRACPPRRAGRCGSGGPTRARSRPRRRSPRGCVRKTRNEDLADAGSSRLPARRRRRGRGAPAAPGSAPARRRRACPAGTFFVTTAPGAGPRALADLDGRDEHRVDAQERVRRRSVVRCFVAAVPVGGDRAGADVRAVADRRRRRGSSCGAA